MCSDTQLGKDLKSMELIPEESRVEAPCWALQPVNSAQERKAPKNLGFENENYI